MRQIHECRPIREILEVADAMVSSEKIAPGVSATMVEIVSGDDVEGTILYFPGVNSKQLLKGF